MTLDATLVKEGLTLGLGQLNNIFVQNLASTSVPLLGQLNNTFVPSFITNLVSDLTAAINDNDTSITADALQAALQTALPSATVTLNNGTNTEFTIDLSKDYTLADIPLSSDLGVPVLNLKTSGKSDVTLKGDARLTFGFNANSEFYIDTDASKTHFTTDFDAGLSSDFTAKANLGFLQLALDHPDQSGVQANFQVNLKDVDGSAQDADGSQLTLTELHQLLNSAKF
jgi:hypothetical protein